MSKSSAQRLREIMNIHRVASLAVLSLVVSIAFAATANAEGKAVPGWDPAVFRQASTIKIMTTEPDVGEHWSKPVGGRHRRTTVCTAW